MYPLTPRCHLPPLRRAPNTQALPAPTDPDELRSTWPQRAWMLAGSAPILSSLFTAASLAADSGFFAGPLAAVLVAYSLGDLGSGIYHWSIDNYGDASTPVFGAQIAAFQGHHRYPSTISRKETCNNLHQAARGVALVLPAISATATWADAPAAAHAFAGTFAACVMLSQKSHAWAHENKRRLPPGVEALQAAGVILSRARHAPHHRPPYNSNYCVLNGMWNKVLDRYMVFEKLEMVVYFLTGVRPRSWDEPNTAWREQTGEVAAIATATVSAGDDSLLRTDGIGSD